MVIVIVITGIIGAIVAMFLRAPVQGYVDSARRADMTDIADTALRRMSRDIRLALPNSVRVTTVGGVQYLEYLETMGGGRYNSATIPVDCMTSGNCTALTTVGDLVTGGAGTASATLTSGQGTITAATSIVVYNQYNNAAGDCSAMNPSAYCGHGVATVTGVVNSAVNAAEDVITFAATNFYGGSPNNRFQLVTGPVTYACNPATGLLTRFSGYAIAAVQPTPPAGAGNVMASQVSACTFTYDGNVVAQRSGLVTVHLTITEQGESVTLYNATHVSNVP
jgi:MSHA biogenesis protein MshO